NGPHGILLGVDNDAEYEVGETALPPGSALLLYTDGLTEAEDATGAMFGQQRVIQLLNESESREVSAIVQAAAGAAERFAQGRAPSDDLTLLAVRYNPNP